MKWTLLERLRFEVRSMDGTGAAQIAHDLNLAVQPQAQSRRSRGRGEKVSMKRLVRRSLSLCIVWVAKYKSGGDRCLKQTAAMWPPRVVVKQDRNS